MHYDLYLEWGSDLTIGSTGDIAFVTGDKMTNQRVLRRLLTNPGDYIWNLNYGGGLGQFVGAPMSVVDIEAVIKTQLALETAVPASPAPVVNIQSTNIGTGSVTAEITYTDPSSSNSISLSLPVN